MELFIAIVVVVLILWGLMPRGSAGGSARSGRGGGNCTCRKGWCRCR